MDNPITSGKQLVTSGRRRKWGDGCKILSCPGVLAVFLKTKDNLPDEWKALLNHEHGLLYIGHSDCLVERLSSHFQGTNSTRDTFRRSMGAILREDLGLELQKPSSSKRNQYRFKNEEVLSCWIQQNCEFAYMEVDGNAEEKKKCFISDFDPPVNLRIPIDLRHHTKYKEARKKLDRARKDCIGLVWDGQPQ